MDIPPVLENYGLPGLVIAGLGWAIRTLWDRYNEVQEARLVDLREAATQHAQISREVKTTLDAALAALRAGGKP